ncbi:MAG: PaaI family thioesterase [Proteobacteria bacterium]|nr:PaaI family thioesterase [Pseudomonadota bacterium]MBU1697656.1 PaaI family thioesterase [Pseudomonadota bacterium]
MKAFQDYYAEDFSHCYGCGRLNEHGLQIKSYWEGEESVVKFLPDASHISIPGFVYGGLIASLIDCHCVGTAAAAKYLEEGRDMDTEPALRYVTGSLKVNFLAPTPLGVELEVRGKVIEVKERKVLVEAKLLANGKICATGEVVAVRLPETMISK